jgi:hypothetical protein
MAAMFGALPVTIGFATAAGPSGRPAWSRAIGPGTPISPGQHVNAAFQHRSGRRAPANAVPVRARLDPFPLPSLPLVIKGPYTSLTYQGPQKSMVPSPAWDITDT